MKCNEALTPLRRRRDVSSSYLEHRTYQQHVSESSKLKFADSRELLLLVNKDWNEGRKGDFVAVKKVTIMSVRSFVFSPHLSRVSVVKL